MKSNQDIYFSVEAIAAEEDEDDEEECCWVWGKDCLTCCSMNAGIMSLFVPSFMALLGLLEAAVVADDDTEEEEEWNEGGSNADGSAWCDEDDEDDEPKPVE